MLFKKYIKIIQGNWEIRLIVAICFVLLSARYVEPETKPLLSFDDPTPQGIFERLVIPLKRVNNLFLIEARIDTLEGNFILDTGAPKLVLNKTYFRNYKLSPGTSSYGISGGGEQVFRQKIDSLIIQDLFFTELDADVVNLGHIEDAKGVKILGLLGANLFLDMEIEIDLLNSELILYKIDKEGERIYKGDTITLIADIKIPVETDNNLLFINIIVEEKKLRFCLDTGAEINVLSNTVSNKVLKHFALTSRASLGGSGSKSVDVLNGKLDVLTVGTDTLKNMPFVLTGLTYLQVVYDTTIDGILGYQFLAKGRIVINSKKREFLMYFYIEETE